MGWARYVNAIECALRFIASARALKFVEYEVAAAKAAERHLGERQQCAVSCGLGLNASCPASSREPEGDA
jgi:hypothetical protein